MLHRLIYADWEDPPAAMAFELSYQEALREMADRLQTVRHGLDAALAAPASAPGEYWAACLDLYLLTPALVNVALNYKVCVEHGLPLHPTYYFEVSRQTRGAVVHPPERLERAQTFFLEAIAVSLAIFRLDPSAPARLAALASDLPHEIGGFIYTSTQDKYTWRASAPEKIQALAGSISSSIHPIVMVGAAHGAITAALVLATLLATPLYFIRFSLFKRNDVEPVISPSDLLFLAQYRSGPALLFDEDVAKGTTLTQFTDHLMPLFDTAYSASVLRNAYASFTPDFVGRVWYD